MGKATIRAICGPGSGKTATALGLGMMGMLRKKRVIVVQFLKGELEEKTSEVLKRWEPDMKVFRFERSQGSFENLTEIQKKESAINMINGFNFARKVSVTGECDILIMDEALGLLDQNIISVEEFKNFFDCIEEDFELILTGRVCPEELHRYMDIITYVENKS